MTGAWWNQHPDRLEHELEALRRAGIAFELDEGALSAGIVRLKVEVEVDGEQIPLVVTFPDLYPYFRFEVDAPTLDLDHHQHAFGKNLCLMGRGTHHWHTSYTVASVLEKRLGTVLETGRSADKGAALGREQQQAEPFSDYYPYARSMIIVPGSWIIPQQHEHGRFEFATAGPAGRPPERLVRGAISEVCAADGKRILSAGPEILSAYRGERLRGIWVRSPEPIREFNPDNFRQLIARTLGAREPQPEKVEGGWLQIWGVVFPEEVGWRELGDGWVFVCRFHPRRFAFNQSNHKPSTPAPSIQHQRKGKGRRR